jgi:hypothetical protein
MIKTAESGAGLGDHAQRTAIGLLSPTIAGHRVAWPRKDTTRAEHAKAAGLHDESGAQTAGRSSGLVEPPAFLAGRPDITLVHGGNEDLEGVRPHAATARHMSDATGRLVGGGCTARNDCAGTFNRSACLATLVLRQIGLSADEAVAPIVVRRPRDILTNDGSAGALLLRRLQPGERGRGS